MGQGATSAAASGIPVPSDIAAAVKQLDYERKRLKHVSNSLSAQREYIEKLEDIYMCLEKSLSAYPEADFQVTLIRGLHEKYLKTFNLDMAKWKGDTHAFVENSDAFLESEIDANAKYKRASFKEKVARRASDIFKSHSKSKDQVQNRVEERRLEQRKRLEAKLNARLAEQRKMELRGETPTKSFKQAVHMLTKQILVFGRTTTTRVAPGSSNSAEEKAHMQAQRTRQQIDSGAEIFHPPPGAGNYIGYGTTMNVDKSFVQQHLKSMNHNESPYMMLRKAFLKANTYLKTNKQLSPKQLVVWLANLNKLLIIVLEKCTEIHGTIPQHVSKYIEEEFRNVGWTWQQDTSTIAPKLPKGYTAPLRLTLIQWCTGMANHFDSHHQKKVEKDQHNDATDLLYGEGGLHFEELELTAFETFQKQNRERCAVQQAARNVENGAGTKTPNPEATATVAVTTTTKTTKTTKTTRPAEMVAESTKSAEETKKVKPVIVEQERVRTSKMPSKQNISEGGSHPAYELGTLLRTHLATNYKTKQKFADMFKQKLQVNGGCSEKALLRFANGSLKRKNLPETFKQVWNSMLDLVGKQKGILTVDELRKWVQNARGPVFILSS
jgi:hypothetical protein